MKYRFLLLFIFAVILASVAVAAPPGDVSEEGVVADGADPVVLFSHGTALYDSGHYARALFAFKVAAMAGHPDAAIQVGLMYDFGLGTPKSFYEARRWYLKAADQESPQALYLLGHMEEFGEGRIQDYSKAFHWYQQAADLGESNAQFSLGQFYYDGKFVNKNQQGALRWLSLAAGQCHGQAMALLQDISPEQASWDSGLCY